ncbi:MAG: aquaporin, partial [Candidatus Methylomirabilis sp.]|nr:aquaporin [Deltaproteobacteria bacterium]
FASNHPRLSKRTPLLAGALVALYIAVEAPLSGMSMNPARSFGSAVSAMNWTAIWIYFTAPVVGMLAASEVYVRRMGGLRVYCAKLNHHNQEPCIFRCRFGELNAEAER